MFGAEFQLSAYSKELIVGDIFVRVYNAQPEFKLHEPKKVCVDMLAYLEDHCEELLGEATMKPKPTAKPLPPPKPSTTASVKKPMKNGDLIDFSQPEPPTINHTRKRTPGDQVPLTERLQMVLEALRNLLMMNPGTPRPSTTFAFSSN